MKCLFVQAPFARWIVSRVAGRDIGVKFLEYRTRPTKIRGRIGIVQSKSGTVIGDVEITGCQYSMDLKRYIWLLVFPRQYEKPVSFTPKRGAVVWIEIDYDPEKQKIAPALTEKEALRELGKYGKAIDKFFRNGIKNEVNR
jgi:hypothetical protein